MAEEIVTRFTADYTALQAAVKEMAGDIAKVEDAAEGANAAIAGNANSIGSLTGKTKTLVEVDKALAEAAAEAAKNTADIGKGAAQVDKLAEAEKKAAKAAEELAEAQKDVAKQVDATAQSAPKLNIFQRVIKGIGDSFKGVKNAVQDFGRGARDGFRQAIGEVDQTQRRVVLFKRSVTGIRDAFRAPLTAVREFAKGARDGFRETVGSARKGASAAKDLSAGLGAAGINTGMLGQAFLLLLGPIGLVVGAVAGFLLNLTRLDTVSDSLDKLKAGFTSFLDSLAGNATLEDTINGIREAVELAERLDALNDRAIFNSVRVTRQRADAAVLERQARNRTLTEQERIGLLTQANTLLEQAANTELTDNIERAEIAYRDLVRSIKQQNPQLSAEFRATLDGFDTLTEQAAANILGLQTAGFNVSPDLLKAAADLQNKIVQDETEVGLLKERNENRIASLREANAAKEAENQARIAAARKKAQEEEAKRIQELGRLRDRAERIRTDIETEQARTATLGADGAPTFSTQIFDIDTEQSAAIATAEEMFAEMEALAQGHADELAAIEQLKVATLAAINKKYNDQATAAYQQFYANEEQADKASRAAVTAALTSEQDQAANAIDAKYDALIDSLAKFVTDEDELLTLRNALNRRRQEELDGILQQSVSSRRSIEEQLVDVAAQFLESSISTFASSQVQFREEVEAINRTYADQLRELEKYAESEAEIQEERARINGERARALNEAERKQGRERTKILLDTLQKVLTILIGEVVLKQTAQGGATGGVPGAIAGQAQAAIITAILTGLFSALVSSISGAFKGEEFITGKPDIPGATRDAYWRRVNKGERIVAADKNHKYYEPLHAIHKGKFEQWKRENMVVHQVAPLDGLSAPVQFKVPSFKLENMLVMPEINRYLDGDTGQRMASSIMLAKYYDKNIVEALGSTRKEQRKTNDLLAVIASQRNDRRSSRHW